MMGKLRTLTVLGSTGSIGTNTLDVVRQNPERFQVFALAAGKNIDLLARQIAEFQPRAVAVEERESIDRLRKVLTDSGIPCPELLSGPEALVRIATAPEADT